jgi:hypothetical protein
VARKCSIHLPAATSSPPRTSQALFTRITQSTGGMFASSLMIAAIFTTSRKHAIMNHAASTHATAPNPTE